MRAVLSSGPRTILVNQSGLSTQKFSDLLDVDTSGVQGGYVVYYDAISQLYKTAPASQAQRIDGGEF